MALAHMRCCAVFAVIALFQNCHTPSPEPQERIGIQALGDVPSAFVDSVADALMLHYHASIVHLPSCALPVSAFTDVKTPRYRADSLLAFLTLRRPDSLDLVVGLTSADISATKRGAGGQVLEPVDRYADWGVFGLGQVRGTSCVVSSFRLDERDPAFFPRLRKVAVHETGHALGLPHCANAHCVMRDAVEHISTVDAEDEALCPACAARVR